MTPQAAPSDSDGDEVDVDASNTDCGAGSDEDGAAVRAGGDDSTSSSAAPPLPSNTSDRIDVQAHGRHKTLQFERRVTEWRDAMLDTVAYARRLDNLAESVAMHGAATADAVRARIVDDLRTAASRLAVARDSISKAAAEVSEDVGNAVQELRADDESLALQLDALVARHTAAADALVACDLANWQRSYVAAVGPRRRRPTQRALESADA